MNTYLIIADDFTGSCDAGVSMAKNGIEVHVVSDPNKMIAGKSYVIDTESRNIDAEQSRQAVTIAAKAAKELDFDYYYKKVDSTLRGHIRTEISAITDVLDIDLIVFNSACPDAARTVADGNLYFNGIILCETEIALDPFFLCTESNLAKIIAPCVDGSVQSFDLKSIRSGQIAWDGSKAITFDTETNDDIDRIVEYVLTLGKKVLFVGSAGMANSLIKIVNRPNPALALVGSISDTSRAQVRFAEEKGAQVVKLDMCGLMKDGSPERFISQALDSLKSGYDTVVCSAYDYRDYLDTVKVAQELGMTKEQSSKRTQAILGEVGTAIVSQFAVSGVFLTGGDTAISFIGQADSDSCEILSEPLPIIPQIRLDSGMFAGLNCIAKGGSIGTPETIDYCFNYLKQHQ